MFRKLLIANRGEIAVRIIRTARRLGLKTVAVYSDADRFARATLLADEAIRLGPAPAAESYLDIERILAACRESGAEAVHPGYGFLSENAAFAERLAAVGITFIGPEPEHLRLFGLKHTAREIARRCHVPLLPGSDLLETLRDAQEA
ncbi:MAG TPA: biotin carboxylase N-terminal domain-containing protein, partial [Stellaceae bacterium]|nr:biotin carboxylase N-terminal domain-containing protein [Stellaceae bacterium]